MNSSFRYLASLRPLAAAALVLAGPAQARSGGLPPGAVRTIDFDAGAPPLAPGSPTPIRLAVDGLEVSFRDPADPRGYAVQSQATTQLVLAGFEGLYLAPTRLDPGPLVIGFGQAIRRISLSFATADSNQAETATAIQLTAYDGAVEVGVARARGTYGTGTLPAGTVTFDSGGAPFDSVVLAVPPQPNGSRACLIDNLVVILH